MATPIRLRSEEHTSELQSQSNLVCRLLLEKKIMSLRETHRRNSSACAASPHSRGRAAHEEGGQLLGVVAPAVGLRAERRLVFFFLKDGAPPDFHPFPPPPPFPS